MRGRSRLTGSMEPKLHTSKIISGSRAGGPLFVPKLFNFSKVFWFVNYNGTRLRNGIDSALNEPTLLQRSGNFSQTSSTIYDPLTGLPFPGNVIPQSRISPIAQGLLTYLPLPNQNVAGVNQNYRFIASNPSNTAESQHPRQHHDDSQGHARADASTCKSASLKPSDLRLLRYGERPGHQYQSELAATGLGNAASITCTLSFNRNTKTTVPFFATMDKCSRRTRDSGHFAQSASISGRPI